MSEMYSLHYFLSSFFYTQTGRRPENSVSPFFASCSFTSHPCRGNASGIGTGYTFPVRIPRFSRVGLLPRLALSLLAVGIIPLVLASIQLIGLNREAMTSQVLRTHSLAARATAERISSELRPLISRIRALATSPIIAEEPRSRASKELLTGTLRSDDRIRGLVLVNSAGEEVLRVQHRNTSELLDWAAALVPETQPRIADFETRQWLILDEELSAKNGRLRLIADASSLSDLLDPEDLGREAVLGLISWEGMVLKSPSRDLQSFPQTLIHAALTGKIGGAGRFRGRKGEVLGAFAPVPLSHWVVISRQPAAIAEAAAMQMRRRAVWTLGLVFCLVVLLIGLAYRNIIRPLKELDRAQRKLVGLSGRDGGDEVQGLVQSFRILQQRMKDRENLGNVFLGRYLVIDVIGQGAMGTVFRGWDPKLQRPVALKTIRPRREDNRKENRRLVTGLLREAVMAASFSHPNIVGIYDVEDDRDAAFVAMELIDGLSLGDYLHERGKLAQNAAIHVGLAISEALAAAHQRNIIHQDIKPGNVLLGYDGAVKVVDFGISRTLNAALPSSDLLFGTPGYLPPEALDGEGFDTRGDLFAMGVVLYYAVSGHHPFLGSTLADTYQRTMSGTVTELSEISPTLDERFRNLIMALISADPECRPSPAASVSRELRKLSRELDVHWIPPDRESMKPSGVLYDDTLVQIIPTTRLRNSSSVRLGT